MCFIYLFVYLLFYNPPFLSPKRIASYRIQINVPSSIPPPHFNHLSASKLTQTQCFARIILDKIVGIDGPWMSKIKSPAYKNMSPQQLSDAINLGKKILDGHVDLVELDIFSLEVRGKVKGRGKVESEKVGSGKSEDGEEVVRKRKRRRENKEGEEEKGKRIKGSPEDREETNKPSNKSTYSLNKTPRIPPLTSLLRSRK